MRAWRRFSLAFTPAIHEKTGEENLNPEFIYSSQTVSAGAELLLRYTLLGLERTSWSLSHIFHSLASLANLSRLGTSGPQKSYDELTSLEIASGSGAHWGSRAHHSKSNILPPLRLSQISAFPYALIKTTTTTTKNPRCKQNINDSRRRLSNTSYYQLIQCRGGVRRGWSRGFFFFFFFSLFSGRI